MRLADTTRPSTENRAKAPKFHARAVADALISATSTHHVRRPAWICLAAFWACCLVLVVVIGSYCDPASGRCPENDAWPREVWGNFSCRVEYCEQTCHREALIKAPVGALSNIAFVLVGAVIFVFGVQDFAYFHLSQTSGPPPLLQDYSRTAPPNLILGGAGILTLVQSSLGAASLVWAGIASFIFHASMTPYGNTIDMASVWTIVVIIMPFFIANTAANLCYSRSPLAGKATTALSIFGMIFAFAFPISPEHRPKNSFTSVPIAIALNFVLLLIHFVSGRRGPRSIRLRARRDLFWMAGVFFWFGVASQFQSDKRTCIAADHFFQGHAVWHSGMALGVLCFYLFLRQERPLLKSLQKLTSVSPRVAPTDETKFGGKDCLAAGSGNKRTERDGEK